MRYLFVVFVLITVSGACQKMKASGGEVPKVIQHYIDSLKKNPGGDIGSVTEYQYQGKLVYVFGPSQYLSDGFTQIKSADGAALCNVGGFAGLRDCNGDNFFDKAVLKRKLWSEEPAKE